MGRVKTKPKFKIADPSFYGVRPKNPHALGNVILVGPSLKEAQEKYGTLLFKQDWRIVKLKEVPLV